ncbi:hypothetical protein [Vibrio phage vB_ValP_FGH]|nr:hypothetical protein [Vibrio phage vB_ValP_FGH]
MKRLLTSAQAAEYLGYSEYTLRKSRSTGVLCGHETPKYIKLGPKAIRYEQEALDQWIAKVSGE